MKTRIIFAAMMFVMMSAEAFEPKQNCTLVSPSSIETKGGDETIVLMGKFPPPDRSQTDPITASVDDANLYVDFHANLGSLTITISSATGAVVHTENTVAYANDGVQISLSNLPSGNYLVVFSNAQGSLMGKFSI